MKAVRILAYEDAYNRGGRQLGIRARLTFYVNGTFTDVSFGLQHLEESVERARRVARSIEQSLVDRDRIRP
jgi:hypothetical protein